MQHTFFVHFIVVVLYDYNVKLPETSRVTRFMEEVSLLTVFTLVNASISHFLTAATNVPCCSSNKKMSPLFLISRSSSLSRYFSLSFADLSPTFSFSLYSKFVDMN